MLTLCRLFWVGSFNRISVPCVCQVRHLGGLGSD
jgi:hypothetical protein